MDNGRIAVQIVLKYSPKFEFSCNIVIRSTNERDNGTWKGVIEMPNPTVYHEFTQELNVTGKYCNR